LSAPGHVLDAAGIRAFLAEHFPAALEYPTEIHEPVGDTLVVSLSATTAMLRPGNTISGPTLMTLADTAMYYLLLAKLGPVALAVTTSMHIDFLRRAPLAKVFAKAELLKLGKTLAVGRVTITSDGDARPIAHASLTYSLPPR